MVMTFPVVVIQSEAAEDSRSSMPTRRENPARTRSATIETTSLLFLPGSRWLRNGRRPAGKIDNADELGGVTLG
jgi:hypothetical protein